MASLVVIKRARKASFRWEMQLQRMQKESPLPCRRLFRIDSRFPLWVTRICVGGTGLLSPDRFPPDPSRLSLGEVSNHGWPQPPLWEFCSNGGRGVEGREFCSILGGRKVGRVVLLYLGEGHEELQAVSAAPTPPTPPAIQCTAGLRTPPKEPVPGG